MRHWLFGKVVGRSSAWLDIQSVLLEWCIRSRCGLTAQRERRCLSRRREHGCDAENGEVSGKKRMFWHSGFLQQVAMGSSIRMALGNDAEP